MAMLDRFQGLFKKKTDDEAESSSVLDQDIAALVAQRLAPINDELADNVLLGDDGEPLDKTPRSPFPCWVGDRLSSTSARWLCCWRLAWSCWDRSLSSC